MSGRRMMALTRTRTWIALTARMTPVAGESSAEFLRRMSILSWIDALTALHLFGAMVTDSMWFDMRRASGTTEVGLEGYTSD